MKLKGKRPRPSAWVCKTMKLTTWVHPRGGVIKIIEVSPPGKRP